MREIKFRQWMGGDFAYWGFVGGRGFTTPTHDTTAPSKQYNHEQFTGLLDKNGTEIYEGDIVEFRANYTTIERCGWQKAEVAWDDEYARFELRVATHDEPFDIAEHTDEFRHKAEVIGNIHENPELLQ